MLQNTNASETSWHLQSNIFEDENKYTSSSTFNLVSNLVPRNSAEYIAAHLQKSKRAGRGRWMACCPAHGDRTPSLQISQVEGKVLVKCFGGCRQSAVINALKTLGLWSGLSSNVIPMRPPKRAEIDWHRRAESIKRIWSESKDLTGTTAELYLRQRGYKFDAKPLDLRFHPSLQYWHGETLVGEFPGMVAAVRNGDGKITTLQRTFLSADGSKAHVPGDQRKFMQCSTSKGISGGAIRLFRVEDELGIAEGVEKALQCYQATSIPTWSGMNSHAISLVEVPAQVAAVTIFADNDLSGAGQRGAAKLRQRLKERGLKVKWLQPKTPGVDFSVVFGGK